MRYSKNFNNNSLILFKNLLKYNIKDFKIIKELIKTILFQKKAYKTRQNKENETGVHIPAIMMISITNNCNLNCKGCYQKAQKRNHNEEMSSDKIISILNECQELGISSVMILGGEPLLRKDLFDITSRFNNITFGLFTNGQLINDKTIEILKQQRNIFPVFSMEGYKYDTDFRRGEGVYEKILSTSEILKKNKIIYGISLTVTSDNFKTVTEDSFVEKFIDAGSKFFFYLNYIPVDGKSNELELSKEKHKELSVFCTSFRKKFKSLCFSPSSEKNIGGCIGAGRDMIHINFDGAVEPCPYAAISDRNIKNSSLLEALKSELLSKIREHKTHIDENNTHNCIIWENKEMIDSLNSKNINSEACKEKHFEECTSSHNS